VQLRVRAAPLVPSRGRPWLQSRVAFRVAPADPASGPMKPEAFALEFVQLYNLINWTNQNCDMNPKPDGSSAAIAAALPLLVVDRLPSGVAPRVGLSKWRRWKAIGAAVLGALFVSTVWTGLPAHQTPRVDTGSAQRPGALPPLVVALGRLAPQGELRTLAAPFGAGDARVAQILVEEGQQVTAGAPLAVFDSSPVLEAALGVAQQQLASRRAALVQAERAVASSQAEAAAAAARDDITARAADVEYRRWAALVAQGFVSAAAAEQRRTQRDEAAEELSRARATLARHAGEGSSQPDLQVARSAVDAAQAELARARQDLGKAVLRAPSDGTVIAIHARPGERPGAAGVFDFGDTRAMTAELEVYQSDVMQVRLGQRVTLQSPALAERLSGRISRIGQSVGRQRLTDASPAANTDARVVQVTAVLDDASAARSRSLVGLEVRAEIDTTRQAAP
jgi:HlyD family secretion protein